MDFLNVSVQIGKFVYPLCALEQEEIDAIEKQSGWAVGIPTSYAIYKEAVMTLFPAPDQAGYTLLVTSLNDQAGSQP